MPESVTVTPIELLAVIPAEVAGQPSIVLTVRMNPTCNLTPTHLSVSKVQAERLRDDLTAILERDNSVWSS
jgi:hypothetical protein